MKWMKAIEATAVEPGSVRSISLDGESFVICCVAAGEVYAVEDTCSHDDGPLGQGKLEGGVIECPRHGARFDVRTGEAIRMPAASPIDTFPARITADGWIEVDVEGAP